MAVSCKRVGCRVPASTTLVIDARHATVTLVDIETASAGVTLCAVHVASVTAPVGWTLADDRQAELRLLPAGAASGGGAPGEAQPRRRRTDVAAGDEPFPWHHHFDEDQPETLHASSPLLTRAFRASV